MLLLIELAPLLGWQVQFIRFLMRNITENKEYHGERLRVVISRKHEDVEDLSHSWLYLMCMQKLTNIYSRKKGNDGYRVIYSRLDFILLGFTLSFLYSILFI